MEDALRGRQSQGRRYETGIVIVLKNHVKTSQCPLLREGDLELIYKCREKIKKMSTFPKKNAHCSTFLPIAILIFAKHPLVQCPGVFGEGKLIALVNGFGIDLLLTDTTLHSGHG